VTVGWEPDLPAIRRGLVLDPFCGTATSGEVALNLGRHFIGIELYENHAQIAEDRCHRAYIVRSEFEAKNPMKASTATFDEILNDKMPGEVRSDIEMVNRAAC
jgi:DNA modification methylase